MKPFTSPHPVTFLGTGSCVPQRVLTNADLEQMVDTSDEWITTRTGIKERRLVAEGETTSDLATCAAKRALDNAGVKAHELDLIIVATITPDTLTPATACYIQRNLEAFNALAFDISAACAGYLYAIRTAESLLASGAYQKALVIGAEVLSSVTNWQDRNTCVLFGDGAGACILGKAKEGQGRILSSSLGTDSKQIDLLKIPGGGVACPITPKNIDSHPKTLQMQGREVFKLAVNAMRNAAESVIASAKLSAEDINLVIPHQANLRIIDAIADRLKVDKNRVFINLEKYGNTSSASIAIALDEANKQGVLQRGDKLVLVAFGAGLTWGAMAIEW